MRHYEIVFLVHPDQSTQVPEMIERYKSIIESSNGKVHRLEDWGLRQLAYPIKKSNEAYYVLMNIECTQEVRKEITDSFQFSDAVLRNLILNKENPIVEHSPIKQAMEKAEKSEREREQALAADADMEKDAFADSEDEYTEEVDENAPTDEADTVKAAENNTQPDESDNEKSDDDATLEIDNARDTPTEDEHVDSTKN